ncbi:MAG: AMIN domain-containing protein, partial [Candidatus Melainabacteria bacterium]|nr:AMIN domain-containing protein [Candidatus Melainabacteria bacterium]
MSRLRSRLTLGVFILLIWLTQAHLANAQQVREVNRIISAVSPGSGELVVLNTVLAQPVAAPSIQYFPSGDGQTIMVCDFADVVWADFPQVLTTPIEGLSQIRLGQLQNSPPIFRVAIAATKPALLQSIAFRAVPGCLVIECPQSKIGGSRKSSLSGSSQPQPAPETVALVAHPRLAPMSKSTPPVSHLRQPVHQSTDLKDPALEGGVAVGQDKSVPKELSPEIIVEGANPVTITITSPGTFLYRSFRLSNPERYVVDIDCLLAFPPGYQTNVATNPFVKSIRIGCPNDDQKTTRIVLDVLGEDVEAKEIMDKAGRQLSIVVG